MFVREVCRKAKSGGTADLFIRPESVRADSGFYFLRSCLCFIYLYDGVLAIDFFRKYDILLLSEESKL